MRSDAAETARIMESVKDQTETDDKDNTPDGLAYNVSNFELEVERCVPPRCVPATPFHRLHHDKDPGADNNFLLCMRRFLEVDSWNTEHGIHVTDEVEEKIVEEMKAAQVAGDEKRSKMKGSFEATADSLACAEQALQDLNSRLEQAAKDAEAASTAESSGTLPAHLALPSTAWSERSNPYAEYKALLSSRSTASARSEGGESEAGSVFSEATGLDVNNAAVRSRITKLRAESELLRRCAKEGNSGRGDFSDFRKALSNKNS